MLSSVLLSFVTAAGFTAAQLEARDVLCQFYTTEDLVIYNDCVDRNVFGFRQMLFRNTTAAVENICEDFYQKSNEKPRSCSCSEGNNTATMRFRTNITYMHELDPNVYTKTFKLHWIASTTRNQFAQDFLALCTNSSSCTGLWADNMCIVADSRRTTDNSTCIRRVNGCLLEAAYCDRTPTRNISEFLWFYNCQAKFGGDTRNKFIREQIFFGQPRSSDCLLYRRNLERRSTDIARLMSEAECHEKALSGYYVTAEWFGNNPSVKLHRCNILYNNGTRYIGLLPSEQECISLSNSAPFQSREFQGILSLS